MTCRIPQRNPEKPFAVEVRGLILPVMSDSTGAYYRRRASRLAMRANLLHWMEGTLPAWLWVHGMVGVAILVLRLLENAGMFSMSGQPWRGELTGGYLLGLVLASWWGWRRTRARFLSEREGMVLLDEAGGYAGRLCAAQEGAVDWPQSDDAVARLRKPLLVRWRLIPWGMLAAVLLVPASLAMPLPAGEDETGGDALRDPNEPAAWSELEEQISDLREVEAAESSALTDLEEALEALRAQDAADWFNEASLEATEALEAMTAEFSQQSMADLSSMAANEAAMSPEFGPEDLGGAGMPAEGEGFAGTTPSGWEPGEVPGGLPEGMNGLNGMPEGLTPEMMETLRERAEMGGQTTSEAMSMAGQEMVSVEVSQGSGQGPGQGEGEGSGEAQVSGVGGSGQGGDPVPMLFRDREELVTLGSEAPLNGIDWERALLGDTIRERFQPGGEGEAAPGRTPGFDATGRGGSGAGALWNPSLTPQENAILRRYFQSSESSPQARPEVSPLESP